eukprot:CAMPEP_0196588636 /NCGR_PEP_ID=MMETSP1081-20130531/61187_1 /TAXON_ID=36882 /ORGANISM="Pyramimonas amylifera, Strain CCMP720" /LENGTH=52 /DNA_ID=CAMNT_0041911183 /DNA_START=97 /DNA_END=252 /DNA_ORIENTATION=+
MSTEAVVPIAEVSYADLVKEKLPYYEKRRQLFDQYKARQEKEMVASREANVP